MSQVCGHCAKYCKRPFNEDVCLKTGRIVPYLAHRDCFVPKVEEEQTITNDTIKMADNAKTKVCKECGRELPIEQFRENYKSRDGHLNTCFDCLNKKTRHPKKHTEVEGKKEVKKDVKDIHSFSDKALADELRSRGWDVICTKEVSL